MKDVKKLIHKKLKTICKTAKDVPLTRLTRDWIKEVIYRMKAIRFNLRLIIYYVITKQKDLSKIEDRHSISNIIIMNIKEGYGDD